MIHSGIPARPCKLLVGHEVGLDHDVRGAVDRLDFIGNTGDRAMGESADPGTKAGKLVAVN